MSFTYAELKTAIQNYTENTTESSFESNLPLFIKLTEEKILKNVQLSVLRRNSKGSLVRGYEFLELPNDYLSPFSLSYIDDTNGHSFLQIKDPSFIQEFNPDKSVTGKPKYYAVYDIHNFIIAPTPDNPYHVNLNYLYRPPSLTEGDGNGTTWLSINADIAMLYGSLVEAYTYMKGDDTLLKEYDSKFQIALQSLKAFGENKEVTDQYRYGKLVREAQ